MRYHYTNAQNQPLGPVEYSELERLATENAINDNTAVIEEGGQQWTTWSALKHSRSASATTGASSAGNVGKYSTILGDTVAVTQKRLTRWLSPTLIRNTLQHAGYYGHFAVVVGTIFGLVFAIRLSQQMNSVGVFATAGLAMLLLVGVAQFSAQRFMSAGAKVIASTPNRLASQSFLDCVGLFSVFGAFALTVGGIVTSIKGDTIVPLVTALLPALMLVFFAALALHPEELNVTTVEDASAGEEAVALLSFVAKAILMLAPLVFALLAVVGALVAILSVFDPNIGAMALLISRVPMVPGGDAAGGMILLVTACLVPVLSYLWFLLTYLGLDLLRAILAVPAKLDALKR